MLSCFTWASTRILGFSGSGDEWICRFLFFGFEQPEQRKKEHPKFHALENVTYFMKHEQMCHLIAQEVAAL